jgi:hypothetical protein
MTVTTGSPSAIRHTLTLWLQHAGFATFPGPRAEVWCVAVGRYRGQRFRLRCGEGKQGRLRAERAAAELAAGSGTLTSRGNRGGG